MYVVTRWGNIPHREVNNGYVEGRVSKEIEKLISDISWPPGFQDLTP